MVSMYSIGYHPAAFNRKIPASPVSFAGSFRPLYRGSDVQASDDFHVVDRALGNQHPGQLQFGPEGIRFQFEKAGERFIDYKWITNAVLSDNNRDTFLIEYTIPRDCLDPWSPATKDVDREMRLQVRSIRRTPEAYQDLLDLWDNLGLHEPITANDYYEEGFEYEGNSIVSNAFKIVYSLGEDFERSYEGTLELAPGGLNFKPLDSNPTTIKGPILYDWIDDVRPVDDPPNTIVIEFTDASTTFMNEQVVLQAPNEMARRRLIMKFYEMIPILTS